MENLNQLTEGIVSATNEQNETSQNMSDSMKNLTKITQEINSAMKIQSDNTVEVHKTVEVVTNIATENKQSSDEFVSFTKELEEESKSLEQIVTKFQI